MEKTVEKSQEQAYIIKVIAAPLMMLDVEYCKGAAHDMLNQAIRQEAMAVLNPSHPQLKNEILREQGRALLLLCEYVKTLQGVDKMKERLKDEEGTLDAIKRQFI